MARKINGKVTPDALRAAVASGEIEFVGTWEAADILGVERPRIGRWLNRWREWVRAGMVGPEPSTKIPKPIADPKSGPVWIRSEIEAAAVERQRARETAAA